MIKRFFLSFVLAFSFLSFVFPSQPVVYSQSQEIGLSGETASNYSLMRSARGVLDGLQREHFKDGSVRREKKYLNGLAHGQDVLYFPSGKIQMERSFFEGKLQGRSVEYDEAGKVIAEFFFEKGKIVGSGIKLNQHGAFVKITEKPENGVYAEYYSDGLLKKETPFLNGKEEGLVREFARDGRLLKESAYKNGQLSDLVKVYDKHGNVIEENSFEADVWQWTKHYDRSGNVKSEMKRR